MRFVSLYIPMWFVIFHPLGRSSGCSPRLVFWFSVVSLVLVAHKFHSVDYAKVEPRFPLSLPFPLPPLPPCPTLC